MKAILFVIVILVALLVWFDIAHAYNTSLTISARVEHKLKGTLPLQETAPVQQTKPGWEFQPAGVK